MLGNAMNIIKGYSWDKVAARAAVREDEQSIEKEHLLPVTAKYVHPRIAQANARAAAKAAAAAEADSSIPPTAILLDDNDMNHDGAVTSLMASSSAPVVASRGAASSTAATAAVEVVGEVGAFVSGLGGGLGVPVRAMGGGVKELWTHMTRPKGAPTIAKERKNNAAVDAAFAHEVQLHEVRAETEVSVLDDMAGSLARLGVMSKDINRELEVHTVMLSDLDMEMDTAHDQMTLAQKRMEKLIKATEGAIGSKVIMFLLVVIFILIILIIL